VQRNRIEFLRLTEARASRLSSSESSMTAQSSPVVSQSSANGSVGGTHARLYNIALEIEKPALVTPAARTPYGWLKQGLSIRPSAAIAQAS
jgi:hypothetical protein